MPESLPSCSIIPATAEAPAAPLGPNASRMQSPPFSFSSAWHPPRPSRSSGSRSAPASSRQSSVESTPPAWSSVRASRRSAPPLTPPASPHFFPRWSRPSGTRQHPCPTASFLFWSSIQQRTDSSPHKWPATSSPRVVETPSCSSCKASDTIEPFYKPDLSYWGPIISWLGK